MNQTRTVSLVGPLTLEAADVVYHVLPAHRAVTVAARPLPIRGLARHRGYSSKIDAGPRRATRGSAAGLLGEGGGAGAVEELRGWGAAARRSAAERKD